MEPELDSFTECGIYRLDQSGAVFVDPVRLLNASYSRFRLSPSVYYSRHFPSSPTPTPIPTPSEKGKRKRKRRRKLPKQASLNERELRAENRHQQLRPLLLDAHRKLLQASQLLNVLPRILDGESAEPLRCRERVADPEHNNFIQLGSNWRAPFCQISLSDSHRVQNDANHPQGFIPLLHLDL